MPASIVNRFLTLFTILIFAILVSGFGPNDCQATPVIQETEEAEEAESSEQEKSEETSDSNVACPPSYPVRALVLRLIELRTVETTLALMVC